MQPISFDRCFGWLHDPADRTATGSLGGVAIARDIGIVLCPGLLDDGCSGHRPLRQLADALALSGYPTMRFDYPGTGDSGDGVADDAWAVWLASVHGGCDWLKANAGARRVVLVGLRFGAMLAAVTASDRTDIAGLVLLAPVLRGRTYLRQLAVEAKPNGQAVPRAFNPPSLALREIQFSEASVRAIGAIDLRTVGLPPGCRAAVFAQSVSPVHSACVAAWREAGAAVDDFDFSGLDAMLRPTFLVHDTQAEVERVVAWLSAAFPEGLPVDERIGAGVSAGIDGGTWHETPHCFGQDGRLVGVLCQPAGRPAHDTAMLIGNSSGNPHYGYARFAVTLARRFAEAGVASLRFDFAGLGDSVAEGDAPGHCFETDRSGDVAAAIDILQAHGYRHFAIAGLCSGAYHALRGGLSDVRIGTLLLVNLPLFRWRAGDSVEFYNHATENPARFLSKLADRSVWSRLVQGRLELRQRFAMQGLWLANRTQVAVRGLARLLGVRPPAGFAQRAMRILSARSRTLFLLTEGDESIKAVAEALGDDGLPLGSSRIVMQGIDHSVTEPWMQHVIADRMLEFLDLLPVAAEFERDTEKAAA